MGPASVIALIIGVLALTAGIVVRKYRPNWQEAGRIISTGANYRMSRWLSLVVFGMFLVALGILWSLMGY